MVTLRILWTTVGVPDALPSALILLTTAMPLVTCPK